MALWDLGGTRDRRRSARESRSRSRGFVCPAAGPAPTRRTWLISRDLGPTSRQGPTGTRSSSSKRYMEPWRCHSATVASILTTGTALIPRARPPVLSHPLYHQKRPPTSRNRAFELAPAAVRRDCTPRAYFAAPLSSVIFCHEFFLPLLSFSPHPRGKKRRRIRTVYLFSAEYIFTCPYETFKIYLVVILLFRYILYHTWKTIVSHPLVYNVSDLCGSLSKVRD